MGQGNPLLVPSHDDLPDDDLLAGVQPLPLEGELVRGEGEEVV